MMIWWWQVNVAQVKLADGRTINASKFGQNDEEKIDLELTPEEQQLEQELKVWYNDMYIIFIIHIMLVDIYGRFEMVNL